MAEEPLDLFAADSPLPSASADQSSALDLNGSRARLKVLAAHDAFLGTSSWKYPGWCGLVYDEGRYLTRGKFSEAKFNKTCLVEYAQTFSTVCVDAGYYQFPTPAYIAGLCDQVPDGFRFAFKVTDEITQKRFPNIPRCGARAGQPNANFLNAEIFNRLFLGPLRTHQDKIGPLMLEFSTFHATDYGHGRDFMAELDGFLGALPKGEGWEFGVEMRNKAWLVPEYFAMLGSHGVAHVFNNWTKMPPVLEQLALEGSQDTADFTVARFLLKPGRGYESSVEYFSPYKEIKERVDDAKTAAEKILEASFRKKKRSYLYVNNRLEGCAPLTLKNWLGI